MGMATVFVDYLTGNAFTAPAPLNPRRVRFTITPVMRFKEAKKLAQAKAQPKKYAGVQGRFVLQQLEVLAERETKANDDDFNRCVLAHTCTRASARARVHVRAALARRRWFGGAISLKS